MGETSLVQAKNGVSCETGARKQLRQISPVKLRETDCQGMRSFAHTLALSWLPLDKRAGLDARARQINDFPGEVTA